MGSIGNSTITSEQRFTSLPETHIKPLAPTKYAKEVFNREYTRLRALARESIAAENFNVFGYPSLHSGVNEDTEASFSKRMIQGVQSLINSEWRGLELDKKLGIAKNPERELVYRYALTMMQNMVNSYHRSMWEE